MSKPSLLICTPAFGGLFYLPYVESLLATREWLATEDIPSNTHLMGNESLITRARNTSATVALNSGFDKLLFIDADLAWETKDIWRLYYSDKKIIGGTYPIKNLPISLNFNALPEQQSRFGFDKGKSLAKFREYAKEANDCGEIEVEHLPTGFMMISCDVLKDLKDKVPHYGSNHLNGRGYNTFYDFFRCGAHDGSYESEDWNFSRIARQHGHSVWLNTNIILPHTGSFSIRADM